MRRLVPLAILFALAASACTTGGRPAATNGGVGPKEGDPAPTFELTSAQGDRVSLEDLLGRKPALLYFSMGPG